MPRISKGKESNQAAGTPQWIFEAVHEIIPCGIDLAADSRNTKCALFYDEQANSLVQPWHQVTHKDSAGWCNHPYENCGIWIGKAHDETVLGATAIQFQPAALHRTYYTTYVKPGPCATVIINHPIKFDGYSWSSPILHALFIWNWGLLGSGLDRIHEVDLRKPKEVAKVLGAIKATFV